MPTRPADSWFADGERIWASGGCLRRVINCWERAAGLRPTCPSYQIALAFAYAIVWEPGAVAIARRVAGKARFTAESRYIEAWSLADQAVQCGSTRVELGDQWGRAFACLNAAEEALKMASPSPRLLLARLYALGRLRRFDVAVSLSVDLLMSWPWPATKMLLVKAVEKILLDAGLTDAHARLTELLVAQHHIFPLLASWALFNRAVSVVTHSKAMTDLADSLSAFNEGLRLHRSIEHDPDCQEHCRFLAQIAHLQHRLGQTAGARCTIADACARYPTNSDLLHCRAMLMSMDEGRGRIGDLSAASDAQPKSLDRINALLCAALEDDAVHVFAETMERGLALYGGLNACDDCLFLDMFVEASIRLGRLGVALIASNRLLQLTMVRDVNDPERLAAYEGRSNLFLARFEHNDDDSDDWPWHARPIDVDGRTPLTKAAGEYAYEAAAVLIQHGAPIDAIDGAGRSALFVACQRGDAAMVRLLASLGAAKVPYVDVAGRTPLEVAGMTLGQDAFEPVLCAMRCGYDVQEARHRAYEVAVHEALTEAQFKIDADCFRLVLSFVGRAYPIPIYDNNMWS